MVTIKSKSEIEKMKIAGSVTYGALAEIEKTVKPGMTTAEVNRIADRYIRSHGCTPSKGYGGFPGSICTSVNDVIIHGIPGPYVLKEGDLLSVDIVSGYKGYHGDAARTFGVGRISDEAQRLIDATKQSFFEGIEKAREGYRIGDISAQIQHYVENHGFSVLRGYCGHGIGSEMHEDPEIPNFARKRKGILLQPGMTLAIEPMITEGSYEVVWLDDDWTVMTEDGGWAAHYENTILITENEPEILSL